jgi:hypothetical protein
VGDHRRPLGFRPRAPFTINAIGSMRGGAGFGFGGDGAVLGFGGRENFPV